MTSIISYIKKPFSVSAFASSTKSAATLSVPSGRKALYEQTEGWDFTHIVEWDLEEGEVFTEKTVENIEMMFMVTNVEDKTCQVSSGSDSETAVAKTTEGALTIPSIVRGYTVTAIAPASFKGCKSLDRITLSLTIKSIGEEAFANADNLATVMSEITEPFAIPATAFAHSDGSAPTLYLPLGTKERYLSTAGWSQFGRMIETAPAGTEFAVVVNGVRLSFKVTDQEGRTCQLGLGQPDAALRTAKHVTIPNEVRDQTVTTISDYALADCSELLSLSVPETVQEVGGHVLDGCSSLAAMQWKADKAIPASLTENISNPNLLLYVNHADYAPATVQNVVVGGVAENIVLKEAASGNNFYCMEEFTAKSITYTHNYSMTSGYKVCQGWETIVLPFDVTSVVHESYAELVPITTWEVGSEKRSFWLYEQTTKGWKTATAIKANTPYIICLPNNEEQYDPVYCVVGNVTFRGTDVKVAASDKLSTVKYGEKIFVPNYQNLSASSNIYALNVCNEWDRYEYTTYRQGSTFIQNLRGVRPFECYMTTGAGFARDFIPVFDDEEVSGIMELPYSGNGMNSCVDDKVYTLSGVKIASEGSDVMRHLPKGIYIINGQKVVIR